jgi:hypothetical protein
MLGFFFEFLVILLLISQIVVPSFIPEVKFFWLFKPSKKEPKSSSTLGELKDEAKATAQQYKSTKAKIDKAEDDLNDIKQQLD